MYKRQPQRLVSSLVQQVRAAQTDKEHLQQRVTHEQTDPATGEKFFHHGIDFNVRCYMPVSYTHLDEHGGQIESRSRFAFIRMDDGQVDVVFYPCLLYTSNLRGYCRDFCIPFSYPKSCGHK